MLIKASSRGYCLPERCILIMLFCDRFCGYVKWICIFGHVLISIDWYFGMVNIMLIFYPSKWNIIISDNIFCAFFHIFMHWMITQFQLSPYVPCSQFYASELIRILHEVCLLFLLLVIYTYSMSQFKKFSDVYRNIWILDSVCSWFYLFMIWHEMWYYCSSRTALQWILV